MEQMGLAFEDRPLQPHRRHPPGPGVRRPAAKMNQFERLEQFAKLQKPPVIKFKDLEASVNSTIKFNILPMQVHADFFPLTESSVLTNITLQLENKDLQFQAKDGVQKAVVNMYGRITSMARRVINVFEDTVTVDSPTELLADISKRSSIYQKSIPLAPGMYRLNIVVRDVVGGNMNNYELALNVPRYDPEKLRHQHAGAGRPDREGSHQEHRHGAVRHRQHKGAAAHHQHLPPRREDGHLHEGL